MRSLVLHDQWARANASFGRRFDAEIVSAVSDLPTEYRYIRDAAGVTDFSSLQKFRVPEEKGVDFLDGLLAGNVAKVRFGRVLHTFLADDDGFLLADCYMANNDEELLLLCESIVDDAALKALFARHGAGEAGVEDLSETHVALSIDGVKAWTVAKELFGTDVLGLPYLSIEHYPFENKTVHLLRAGKTSEFGYMVLAPVACAHGLFEKLSASATKNKGGLCGVAVHDDLRLEGRFFNIFAEGMSVRDPLALGLQWMVDFDKEKFLGREPIMARRAAGPSQKIIGIMPESKGIEVKPGMPLFDDAGKVAEVTASCYSYALERFVGLALFPVACAYSGLRFRLGAAGGPEIKTISMPPIVPKSLSVKLDEM
jgi:aminomethyltransferase